MSLHVSSFGGGIVVDGSADSQRTDEVQVADSLDIGHRGALIVTTDPTDYLTLNDNAGGPAAWSKLWALLESGGFNFSKVLAVGEGDIGGAVIRYIFSAFNREGESSPFAYVAGSNFPPAAGGFPLLSAGPIVSGAEFAGTYWVRFTTPGIAPVVDATARRFYFVCIGAREGFAPVLAPGLFAVDVIPPSTAPAANEIRRYDALGTGSSGSLTVPVAFKDGEGAALGGTNGRQLYFRGIIAYNNHLFGWGYDASDDRPVAISGITNANPGNVTANAHGFKTGDQARIRGVAGMTQVNGQTYTIIVTGVNNFTIGVDTTAFGVYAAGADDYASVGNGDGPTRVMFSNLGRPLNWGFDNQLGVGVDRAFTDSDAIVLGDAGEIIRGAIKYGGKLGFGTNKGLHYIDGYGRDAFVTDGATPVMRAYNVVGPNAMIEGPDKKLYGVSDQGLWSMDALERSTIPVPLFEKLRDYKSKSNGYWDQIWTENTAITAGSFVVGRVYTIVTVGTTDFTLIGAASNTIGVKFTATGVGAGTGTAAPSADSYPGQTNQDLVWMAVDWERGQVIVGIPWCSIANGYGYGTDTILIKYHVATGGFTRQQFTGVQYTAAGYFRAQAQQAAMRFLGTATSGKSTVQRFGYKATNNSTPALPARKPAVRFGPYLPFGPDGEGTVSRLHLTLAWEAKTALAINSIGNSNPCSVQTVANHGLVTGQVVELYGFTGMSEVLGGPYTITVTGVNNFTIGINSIPFGVYAAGGFVGFPLHWICTLTMDEQTIQGQIDQAVGGGVVGTFILAVSGGPPLNPQEGDLWLDTSETDPNLGNATAGTNILALGGILLRVRHDNQPAVITGITKANPAVVTAPAHGFKSGQRVSIRNVAGMVQVNNVAGAGPYTKDFTALFIDADHFSIGVDSTAYGAYTSGGTACLAWALVPGMGGSGTRATMPIPVVRRPGTRFTLDLNSSALARRYQIEGFGFEPGDGGDG